MIKILSIICLSFLSIAVMSGEIVVSGDSAVPSPAQVKKLIAEKLAPAEKLLKDAEAKKAGAGNKYVQELKKKVELAKKLLAAGNFGDAFDIVKSNRFTWLRKKAASNAVNAFPVLMLGPFGSNKYDNVPKSKKEKYKQMFEYITIPYINEYREEQNGCKWKAVARNFSPDLDKEYKGFGGKTIRWIKGIKKDTMTFPEFDTGNSWSVVYFYFEMYSPEVRKAAFLLKSKNIANVGLWHNSYWRCGATKYYGYGRMNIRLSKGWNPVLIKLVQKKGAELKLTLVSGYNRKDVTPMTDIKFRIPEKKK